MSRATSRGGGGAARGADESGWLGVPGSRSSISEVENEPGLLPPRQGVLLLLLPRQAASLVAFESSELDEEEEEVEEEEDDAGDTGVSAKMFLLVRCEQEAWLPLAGASALWSGMVDIDILRDARLATREDTPRVRPLESFWDVSHMKEFGACALSDSCARTNSAHHSVVLTGQCSAFLLSKRRVSTQQDCCSPAWEILLVAWRAALFLESFVYSRVSAHPLLPQLGS